MTGPAGLLVAAFVEPLPRLGIAPGSPRLADAIAQRYERTARARARVTAEAATLLAPRHVEPAATAVIVDAVVHHACVEREMLSRMARLQAAANRGLEREASPALERDELACVVPPPSALLVTSLPLEVWSAPELAEVLA